jgi:hypothetical protein
VADASNITAPTQFVETKLEKYAYRRFGSGPGLPLLCLQHFTGTLDNWDPAVTDPLGSGREVILFESAGLGRSTGEVPASVPLERPSLVRKMLLVGTAPEGGEDIMHMEKSELKKITDVNGVFDNMIPVRNSYMLSEHLPNATLLTYPDAGHGSLFQFHDSFVRQASLFLGEKLWPA